MKLKKTTIVITGGTSGIGLDFISRDQFPKATFTWAEIWLYPPTKLPSNSRLRQAVHLFTIEEIREGEGRADRAN
jgi:hypothetical protein